MAGIRVKSEWHGNRVLGRLGPVRRRALQRGGHQWFVRSQALVPLREGHLQRSGEMKVTSGGVEITYSLVYARIQHEELSYRHAPGRQAKYITDAANPDQLRITIANELRALFR